MQPPSEGRMQFRSHGLPCLSIILCVIEELFGFGYNLMQSQVFCAFCSPFSPAFLHARFGAEPLHGPRGLGWCKGSCLQLSMGCFQSLSHTLPFSSSTALSLGPAQVWSPSSPFAPLSINEHHELPTPGGESSAAGGEV